MELLTVAQMRRAEQAAAEGGLSYLQMMENAGTAAAEWILSTPQYDGQNAVILCGNGNNGGDGAVVARHLQQNGRSVSVIWLCGAPATPSAQKMTDRLDTLPICQVDYKTEPKQAAELLERCDLVIDGIFGIGFHGDLPASVQAVFALCAAHHLPIIALDVPSGVMADNGRVAHGTPCCSATLSFHGYKYAHVQFPAAAVCGKVSVLDIGLPYSDDPQGFVMDRERVGRLTLRPDGDTHKGTFGKAALLVGSQGMAGAAQLAIQGCLRCGIGLCYPVVPRSIYPVLSVAAPEAVYRVYDATNSAASVVAQCTDAPALLVGCGLGNTGFTRDVCYELLRSYDGCLVLDADGINSLASHIDGLKEREGSTVLTPHPGEMARLLKQDVAYVQANRCQIASLFAREYGAVVVLKGAGTIIASPDGRLAINPTGNSGLSKGGSGDLLAGMVTSFCAQGMSPFDAACVAVWLHGAAADLTAKELSQRGMLPTDVLQRLPRLFLQFEA